MHRCLAIAELLRLICEKLEGYPEGNCALGRLAVTCRTFLEPALDSLWAVQSSLVPTLGCIPDFWIHEDPPVVPQYLSRGPKLNPACFVTPANWERVLFYSSRVKTLDLGFSERREGVSPEVLELVRMSFPREHLFPNVRGLGFMFHELCLPHTSLFLSPKITRINVELDPAPAYLPLVPLFGAKCPSLTSICLRYRGGRVEAPYHLRARAASTLIQSLDKIRHLTAGPIDVAACGHLMSLPELKSLAVHVHEILMPEVSSESTFRYLESLEICVARPALAFNFLPALSKACPLNNLQIGLEEATALESEARQLCTVIVDCSPTSVESLSVDFGQYSDAAAVSSDLYTVVPATLRPLLALTELVTINVTVPFGLCLDDAFVSEMAAAWPLVQHLTLRRPYVLGEPSPPSLVTVSSLTVFALRCPDLRSLAIPLSDTPPEPVEEPPQSLRPKQTVLTLLEVMDSHIQKPFPVAAYLSSVFPNIRFVATTRQAMDLGDNDPAPQDAEASKRWKQVQELIPLLVGIRESGITVGCWVWKVWSR